ncbi:hypothetical protein L6773_11855 [Rhodohalobacter sp. WB101]|uniref:Uncharacterized protein n=1 Tax=Rhodohalobacter sulfatireducens TaxID=2911366 RepID=A0ABS9KEH4_9BACT|nr:hypothetical protein [Rhodohalobacter sulfatireducens]MDR9410247.1 hypothetical protein [Balneolaceae bacterium]
MSIPAFCNWAVIPSRGEFVSTAIRYPLSCRPVELVEHLDEAGRYELE